MALSRERMIDRMLAGDPSYNGRFLTGVVTTGIYCLPSCRARKPKPENVRFFQSTEQARAAGLRPCKLCRPDEFEKGTDLDLERLETIIESARKNPGQFKGIEALASTVGVSVSTLHQLFRQHYHSSPGGWLLRARIDAAKHLLISGEQDVTLVGMSVGFESNSGFYESFGRLTGLTPAGYRRLSGAQSFEMSLPDDYCTAELLRVLARDPDSLSERLDGQTYLLATYLDGAVSLRLAIDGNSIDCEVSEGSAVKAHSIVARIVNLYQDPSNFERAMGEAGCSQLIAGKEGLRVFMNPTLWDALVWVIVGQQVNLRFAAKMRNALSARFGEATSESLTAIPSPHRIATLSVAQLQELQFSRQKADYLLSLGKAIDSGELDLESLHTLSATSAYKQLMSVKGFGVWSVNYVMMRGLGFGDCTPLGDTGISSGLQKFFSLDHRPKADECEALMRQFSPYRSLASYHLWRKYA